MLHKNLKRGLFLSPQSGLNEIELYVIETNEDLKAFFKAFPDTKKIFAKFETYLDNGDILLLTDRVGMLGYPTFCTECKNPNEKHPSTFHRIKLI